MRTFVRQNIHYFVILQHVTNALSAFYIKSYNHQDNKRHKNNNSIHYMRKILFVCLAGAALAVPVCAQTQTAKPTYKTFKYEDGAIMNAMSDNGQWGAFSAQAEDGASTTVYSIGARLVNLGTTASLSLTDGLLADTVKSSAALDVTNDGNIVVGALNSKPAYYTVDSKAWHFVKYNGLGGTISSVTPDGRYAVGTVYPSDNEYEEKPALWNLATGDTIATANLPQKDMAHANMGQNRFVSISADGKTVLGCMSFSYLPSGDNPGGCFYYVYNVDKQSYKVIGFTESDTEDWTPKANNLLFISGALLSNNGKYVTGSAYYLDKNGSGSAAGAADEFTCPFKYDVEKDEFTFYSDTYSQAYAGYAVDNGGEVYAAGPDGNPYRDFGVRSGNYWVNFTQGLKQHYNFDVLKKLGFDNSGTPVAISDDSRTIGVLAGSADSYVITLPEPFSNIAATTNLLSAYTASPAAGSTFAKLTTMKLTFTRTVQTLMQASKIEVHDIVDGGATVAKAFGFQADAADPYSVNISFRNANLANDGMPYEIVIPAKAISIKGDATRYNDEIRITYNGRANVPLEVMTTSPKEGSALGKIDASTSPVTFNFDAEVKLAGDSPRAQLYQKGLNTPVASLLLGADGSKLYAYPATQQNLLKDVDYQIVLPAGVVTDITGNAASANKADTLNLRGAYEREISYDSNILYSENFDNGVGNVMLYDGDTNTPDAESKGFNFNAAGNAYAWVPVRDDNATTGYSAASTSLYTPEGTSDDWLVTPQINVMDKLCTLTFKSQSYRKAANDSLKVVVWPCDNIYSALNDEIVDRMKREGTVVYFERESAGKSEAKLNGDWKENTISLEQFAGKNVYIAFVNQNEAQSFVFIDDVQVTHDLPFFAAFDTEDAVVGKTSAKIKGSIVINDSTTYHTLHLTLKDGQGKVVDEIDETGLNLAKGDKHAFSFAKALPLTIGTVNRYSVDFKLGDKENTVSKSISNLSFEPVKRVTLEEFTGMGCTNCPLGILGIDNLHKTYGDLFIPMALHCYTGDQLGAGVTSYAAYLNLTAAPSGCIQRGDITYPITQDKTTGKYSFTPSDNTTYDVTWQSEVQKQLATPAPAEVTATCELAANGKSLKVPVSVKYALNATDLNLKVFAAVLEDGLVGYQSNGFSSVSDPVIGEWGAGGKYGMATVTPCTFDHVVRGFYGETFTGTPELLPATIEAGKPCVTTLTIPVPDVVENPAATSVVVMLFDGNTDKLINAYHAKQGETPDGIDDVLNDNTTAAVSVTAAAGRVVVTSALDARVQVYTIDGRMAAQAAGKGVITLTPAATGMAIVRVSTANGVVTKKVIL